MSLKGDFTLRHQVALRARGHAPLGAQRAMPLVDGDLVPGPARHVEGVVYVRRSCYEEIYMYVTRADFGGTLVYVLA